MKKYKVYLFDFDGTLVDTFPALIYVFQESFAQYGIDVSKEECYDFAREPLNESFERKGGDMTVFWDFVDVINFYLNGQKSIQLTTPYEDTEKTLEILHKMGVIAGIVTSNNVPHIKDVLENHHLDYKFMQVFVGNQECITPKPSPKPIQTALEMINYQGDLKDVVYVGDGRNDALAAKNAGVDAVLLDRDNIYQDEPYTIIHSLLELFE